MCVAEELLDSRDDYHNPNKLPEITREEIEHAHRELMMLFPQIEPREHFTYAAVVAAYIFWSHNECVMDSHKSIESLFESTEMPYASGYDDVPEHLYHATEIIEYLFKPFAAMACAVFFKKRYWSPEDEVEKDIFTVKTWEQIHQTCMDAIASDDRKKKEYQYLASCIEAHFRDEDVA